jgi:predicted DNA-binding transcriptional regulator YafY
MSEPTRTLPKVGAERQSVRDIDICLDGLPIETTFGHAGGSVVQHAPRQQGLDPTPLRIAQPTNLLGHLSLQITFGDHESQSRTAGNLIEY